MNILNVFDGLSLKIKSKRVNKNISIIYESKMREFNKIKNDIILKLKKTTERSSGIYFPV